MVIPEKPALKRTEIDALATGNLGLRPLRLQVGLDRPEPRVCLCYAHAQNSKPRFAAYQSLNALINFHPVDRFAEMVMVRVPMIGRSRYHAAVRTVDER